MTRVYYDAEWKKPKGELYKCGALSKTMPQTLATVNKMLKRLGMDSPYSSATYQAIDKEEMAATLLLSGGMPCIKLAAPKYEPFDGFSASQFDILKTVTQVGHQVPDSLSFLFWSQQKLIIADRPVVTKHPDKEWVSAEKVGCNKLIQTDLAALNFCLSGLSKCGVRFYVLANRRMQKAYALNPYALYRLPKLQFTSYINDRKPKQVQIDVGFGEEYLAIPGFTQLLSKLVALHFYHSCKYIDEIAALNLPWHCRYVKSLIKDKHVIGALYRLSQVLVH